VVAAGPVRLEPVADEFEAAERVSAGDMEPAVIGVVPDQFPESVCRGYPPAVDVEAELPAAPAATAAGAPDDDGLVHELEFQAPAAAGQGVVRFIEMAYQHKTSIAFETRACHSNNSFWAIV